MHKLLPLNGMMTVNDALTGMWKEAAMVIS